MMKTKFYNTLIILLFICHPLIAGQGSAGAKFLQINTTTRGSANAGTMVSRPGLIDALSYNPATTATLTGSNFIIHHSNYFVDMSFDYISFTYNVPSFGTVSMGIYYTDVDTDWFKVFLGMMMLIAVIFNNFIRRRVTESK